MGRPSNPIPKYRKHARSGRPVVDVYRANGKRVMITLPGVFGSEESKAEYQRILATLNANGGKLPAGRAESAHDATINELAARYLDEKATVYYVDEAGKPTTEVGAIKIAIRPLTRLFGSEPASEFDAVALEAVRNAMVSGSWMTDEERTETRRFNRKIGWNRGNVNRAVSRLRSMFRWAVKVKIVPESVVTSLACLPPLKAGRSGGRESKIVIPVPVEIVDATLPHLPPVIADMVRFQLATGCRPGELCRMRGAEIDQAGPVWIYRPPTHKTLHHGHARAIAVGPQAQLILRRHLTENPDAFVFSPAEQQKLIDAAKRAARKTPVQPSQIDRRDPAAVRKPGEQFTVTTYNRAITRGCHKAGVAHWHVHQLRHTAALLIEREHGIEAARAVLGHRTLNMTAHYSGLDTKRAAEVAAKMG